jgi:hypothetical protein
VSPPAGILPLFESVRLRVESFGAEARRQEARMQGKFRSKKELSGVPGYIY